LCDKSLFCSDVDQAVISDADSAERAQEDAGNKNKDDERQLC